MPDLFGPLGRDTEAWVEGGFTPNWNSLLVVPEINGQALDHLPNPCDALQSKRVS
jgi:hypothetical protein